MGTRATTNDHTGSSGGDKPEDLLSVPGPTLGEASVGQICADSMWIGSIRLVGNTSPGETEDLRVRLLA